MILTRVLVLNNRLALGVDDRQYALLFFLL